jgi:signal transduction histidine kinase
VDPDPNRLNGHPNHPFVDVTPDVDPVGWSMATRSSKWEITWSAWTGDHVLLSRLRIRGKLILLVLIPLLAVVALTVPIVLNRVQQANRAGDTAAKVKVVGKVGEVIRDIQLERLLSVAATLKIADQNRVTAATTATDGHIAALKADKSITLPKPVADAIGSTPDLAQIRIGVQAGKLRPDEIVGGYAAIVTKLLTALNIESGVDLKTPEGRQVTALDAALRTDEAISYAVTYLLIMGVTKDPATLVPYFADLNSVYLWSGRLTAYGTKSQADLYQQKLQNGAVSKLGPAFNDPLNTNPITALANVPVALLLPALENVVSVGNEVENKIVSDVTAVVDKNRRNALTTAYVIGGLAVLILLVVILLSLAVARAVVRPLTRLTASADRVARVAEAELVRVADDDAEATGPIHLEAVGVNANDEIGELARAFERVQGTASGLVERQVASRRNVAQMFGHVGRRTQNLVARQVALIDRLEREETDPERLQHLYRLDHVSSRLRRNAGSLVVLSGSASVDEQVSPLPLVDVVRLALGEIEDYTRVDVIVPPNATVVPSVVNDLILMLAELMENATVFSPPHVRVTVSAQPTQYGVQILVIDHGIGLSPERMAQENARLERRERLDLVPTEVLGLFVIGRLARRHGIGVILTPTAGGGVTATVQLGHHLLTGSRTTGPALAPVSGLPVSGGPSFPSASPLVLPPALPAGPTPVPAPFNPPMPPPEPVHRQPMPMPAGSSPFAPPLGVPPAGPMPVQPPAHAAPAHAAPTPAPEPAMAPVTLPVAGVQIFDEAAVYRATRSIATAEPWSAFIPHQRTAPEEEPAPPVPMEQEEPTQPLRQRVPGTNLPPQTATPVTAGTPKASDADAVRALVEDFESGVERAQRHAARPPESIPMQPATLAPASAFNGNGNGRGEPLTRRQPGVTLEALQGSNRLGSNSPTVSEPAADPQQVRDLVEQFEAGVTRALRDARTDQEHGEGTTQ